MYDYTELGNKKLKLLVISFLFRFLIEMQQRG